MPHRDLSPFLQGSVVLKVQLERKTALATVKVGGNEREKLVAGSQQSGGDLQTLLENINQGWHKAALSGRSFHYSNC